MNLRLAPICLLLATSLQAHMPHFGDAALAERNGRFAFKNRLTHGLPLRERHAARLDLLFQFANESRDAARPVLTSVPSKSELLSLTYPNAEGEDLGDTVRIAMGIPESFINSPEFTAYRFSQVGGELRAILEEEGFLNIFIDVRDPKSGKVVDLLELLPPEVVPKWDPPKDDASIAMSLALGKNPEPPMAPQRDLVPVALPGSPLGALSGKTVIFNQGHGWFDDPDVGRYRVQRGLLHGINEDFGTAEFINLWVLPMLRNAGAKVQTVRESDLQTNMVIVDNADGAAKPSRGIYAETGTWTTSTINGFIQKTTASWVGLTVNPFNQGAGANRLTAITSGFAPTATATWTATIPADGYYNVYASWTSFSGRAPDAQYFVHHSGGISEFRINQRIDGYTWNLIGNFYFEKDAPEDQRKVVLTNRSNDPTATNVSADAVRWGGGMGDVARRTNGVSGRPRWEEEAVLNLQFNGFGYSGSLYAGADDESGGWSDRPQYAAWEHSGKDGSVEDAVYMAYHTNAFNGTTTSDGTARGLSSFRHSTATTASTNLQSAVHAAMYAQVNSLFVPGWTVRNPTSGNFGENNQASLGTNLPGFLIEGLFHDNSADANMYAEPAFRYAFARGLTQGLIDYYEIRDGVPKVNPPEIPVDFEVVMLADGTARLRWAKPQDSTNNARFGGPATGYMVYRSTNGFGFDNGTPVTTTEYIATGISTITPVFFRIASTNAGGHSFPGETLAARGGTSRRYLIVNGFDRNQRSQIPTQTVPNLGSGVIRFDPRNFQAFNYSIEHAKALNGKIGTISSASNDAVLKGSVALADHNAVLWISGEESTSTDSFSTSEQTLISNYLALPGKNLLVSGSETAFDLGIGSAADIAFLNLKLRAAYVGDSAGTYLATGVAGGPFASITSLSFSPATGARYNAEFPDRLGTINGSTAVLRYSGGTADTAAVTYTDPISRSRVIMMGFPLEAVSSVTAGGVTSTGARAVGVILSPAADFFFPNVGWYMQ